MERIIKVISFKLALKFSKNIYSGKFQNTYCDIQMRLGDLLKGVIIFGLGFILQIPRECLIILILFGILRYLSGGYHADTFNKCFYQTMLTYVVGMILFKIIAAFNYNIINEIFLTVIFGALTIITAIYAPRFYGDSSKVINKRYKMFSVIFVIFMYCLYKYNNQIIELVKAIKNNNVITAIIIGLSLQISTLTPLFYKILGGKSK